MKEGTLRIRSINELHEIIRIPKPKNPLVSVIPASELFVPEEAVGTEIIQDYYMISLKDRGCGLEYGRSFPDFDEGVIAFSAPGQVYHNARKIEKGEIYGYILYFHPDFIRGTQLGKSIAKYSFFNYELTEALHLSFEEENAITQCIKDIRSIHNEMADASCREEIIIKIEQLLQLCASFYERQFQTRSQKNKDIVSQFERELQQYFLNSTPLEKGLPLIEFFSQKANLSQNYFSDLIKKETGRTPKEHMNELIVEQAKQSLVNSSSKVSEIAYNLGFNYPHYFTRLFKSKTGYTPVEYRNLKLN